MTDLQEIFEYVRKTFFPRWDKKRKWKIKVDSDLPSGGFCDTKTKAILIQGQQYEDDEIICLLIHEICHTYSLSHKEKWQNKFLEKAIIAEEIGYIKLAEMIRGEVKKYREALELGIGSSEYVYNTISDWLLDCPDLSYDSVIQGLANELGMYPEEVEESFKRCGKVYEQAKKEAEEMRNAEERFRKRLAISKEKGGLP